MVYDLTDDVSVPLMLTFLNLSQDVFNFFLSCWCYHIFAFADFCDNMVFQFCHSWLNVLTVLVIYEHKIEQLGGKLLFVFIHHSIAGLTFILFFYLGILGLANIELFVNVLSDFAIESLKLLSSSLHVLTCLCGQVSNLSIKLSLKLIICGLQTIFHLDFDVDKDFLE